MESNPALPSTAPSAATTGLSAAGVELELDRRAEPLDRLVRAAVQDGGAAERQRILQSPRPAGLEERAARELRADLGRRPRMARERSSGDDAGIERRRVSAEPLEAQRDRPVRRVEEVRRVGCREGGGARRVRARRAERQRVARRQRGRRDTGSPERLAAVQHVTVELRAAEAHEGQGEMGERREVCLSDGADRRYDRVHAAVEHRYEGVDDLRRHAGAPDREARDAREERRANQLRRGSRAERGRAPDENAARSLRVVGRQGQPDVGAEARGRAVDALAVRGRPGERVVARRDARARRVGERDAGATARDRDDVLDRRRSRPDGDPRGGRRAQSRPWGADRSGPFEIGTIRRGLSCGCVR